MSNSVPVEKKYRYLLYRIQQALLEMEVRPAQHRGRRHLENALCSCEGYIYPQGDNLVSHAEMTEIKAELFKEDNT